MGANKGHANEYEIINAMNGKKISELPRHFSKWLFLLFNNVSTLLEVKKLNNEQKADILIKGGECKRYISIKSGDSNSFHSEPISSFIPFLRSLGVSEITLRTIVFFHFGDNTFDGTGKTRFTSKELRRVSPERYKKASIEFSDQNIIKEVIERCVTKGRFRSNHTIDGIYHGTVNQRIFLSFDAIHKTLLRTSNRRKNGTINIGMLTYQPGSRNLWGIPGSEIKRTQSEI